MGGLELVPDHRRDAVAAALRDVFGRRPAASFQPIHGGASGALVCRFEVAGRPHVLRLEPERIPFADRQRGYDCMRAAAEVGAAPAVSYADAEAGVAVTAFIPAQPLSAFPGGRPALVQALGGVIARVQAAPPFPVLPDYPEVIGWMLASVAASGLLAPGLLAPHAEALAAIREHLRWDPATHRPAHNDPNPRNLLFDGERLWLVDWELAAMNDPLVDVAIATTEYAETPELEEALIRATFGRAPDRPLRARLAVVRLLTRLFYGVIVLDSLKGQPRTAPDQSLEAFTPEGFRAAVADGRLASGSPATAYAFAKMSLAAFLKGVRAPDFNETLKTAPEA